MKIIELYLMAIRKKIFNGIVATLIVCLGNSLCTSVIFGLFVAFFSGFLAYLQDNNTSILQITHPYERFNASARVLHFSILQHKHLLYLLSKKGLLPYRLVAFLDAMVKQHILESDGATWRFRHGLLQKYFSEQGFE